MVHIHDVVPGDVLYCNDDESDPIISKIEVDGEKRKFFYKTFRPDDIAESLWLDPAIGKHVFIHDLKQERFEFQKEE